jgi:hypothetical protein
MTTAQYRHFGCRITDDILYKGMRTLFLENDLIRVGVLLDKGADIFQFLHKPSDTDFLWRSPQGLIRPDRFTATRASSAGAFLDSYHGGWQEILPGGGPADYRGAELGLHGEVTHLGWDCDILTDTPECIEVRLSVRCLRLPLQLQRVMRLEIHQPNLWIDEVVTNLANEPVEFLWGHHPAFGAPFLKAGTRLFVPAGKAEVHNPRFAASGIFTPGQSFAWPVLEDEHGTTHDLSVLPGPDGGFADLLYLSELRDGWYAVIDPQTRVGFGLAWDLSVFPYLWFWLVYGCAPGFPWWNQVYCIALEPWTSIPNALPKAIEANTQRRLKGGESLRVSLCASAISGRDTVEKIDLNGTVS